MLAIIALIVGVTFVALAVAEYEDDFMPGVYVYSLLSLSSFLIFASQIQS